MTGIVDFVEALAAQLAPSTPRGTPGVERLGGGLFWIRIKA